MEITIAKENLLELIKTYSEKIANTGVKCVADVYFSDEKGLTTSAEQDEISDALCASITISTEDAKDENDKCGFDIILDFTKEKDINDLTMEAAVKDFRTDLDDFIERLSCAEDKNAFIRAESEREKADYAAKMEKFNKEMKRLQIFNICLLGAVILIIAGGIFALLSSL